jgi:nucleotide-binding universal stress UspA family protein
MPAPVIAAVNPAGLDLAPARFGALVAGHTGAPLQVASVYADEDAISPLAGGQLGEPLPPDAGEHERVLADLRSRGVDAEPLEVASTSAAKGLSFLAVETGASLLVVGAGTTAARLLSGAACAVAVVRSEPPERLGVVGAGFVDTAEGREALRGAHRLAARAGARLRVIAAVRLQPWMRRTSADDLRSRAEAAAQAAVSGLLGAPVDVDVAVHDAAELLQAVTHELDVLVTGSRGYGPTPATLLGGVTRKLAEDAACPLIVCARGAPVPLHEPS